MYTDEQLDYHDSDEPSPLANSGGSIGFNFPARGEDFGQLLSAAMGHRNLLRAARGEYVLDDDDDDDDDEEYDEDEEIYDESEDEDDDYDENDNGVVAAVESSEEDVAK